MKKILLVQRTLTHYRKLLLQFVEAQNEFSFDIVSIGNTQTRERGFRTFPAKTLFRYKNYQIQQSAGMINYIKNHYMEYDYIILEGATNLSNNIPIVRFLRARKMPYIVWDAGRRRNSKMSIPRLLAQTMLEYVWKNAAAVMVYSSLAKEYFRSIGIPDSRIYVCQNTVRTGAFDKEIGSIPKESVDELRRQYISDHGKLILYVGAVEPRKRVKDLVDAFERVNKSFPDSALVIIGDGDQLEELKTYAKDKRHVHMPGQIIEGVIRYFMACDVFVLPSEGGLSLNQAMICGKPVIASSADGTELDLIEEGINGFLFEEADIEELAKKILMVLSTPGLSERMGRHSRSIIDQRVNETVFYQNFKLCLESVEHTNR